MSAPAERDPIARSAGRRGAWSAGALAVVALLGFADRPLLGALVAGVRADLWLDDVQLGALAATFAVAQALALGALPRVASRLGRVRALPAGLTLLGGATLLGAAAPFFGALVAARFAAGAAQAAPTRLAPPLLADLQLGRRAGRAAALAAAALPAGTALGYALGGLLAPSLGWRGALASFGGLALLLALGVARLREPLAGPLPSLTPPPSPVTPATTRLAGAPHALALVGQLALAFALGALLFWAPAFLHRARGVPPSVGALELAAIAVMAGLATPVAARLLAAGWWRRGAAPEAWAATAAGVVAAVLGWAAILYPGPEVYLAALTLAATVLFAALAPAAGAVARAAGQDAGARGAGLLAAGALVAGDVAGPVAVGALSELSNLYWAFLAVPLAALAAAVAFAAAAYAGSRRYTSASRPSA